MTRQKYLTTKANGKTVHVKHNVQDGFAHVGIDVCDALAKFIYVGGQQLIGIRYSIVQVRHFVICKTPVKQVEL